MKTMTMHLTTDEILNFITIDNMTPEVISFAAKVNCHIMQCEECRKKVEAFQIVYDKLSGTTLSDPKRNININDISELKAEKDNSDKGMEIL